MGKGVRQPVSQPGHSACCMVHRSLKPQSVGVPKSGARNFGVRFQKWGRKIERSLRHAGPDLGAGFTPALW